MCVILIRTSVVDSDINFRTCSGISIEQRQLVKADELQLRKQKDYCKMYSGQLFLYNCY